LAESEFVSPGPVITSESPEKLHEAKTATKNKNTAVRIIVEKFINISMQDKKNLNKNWHSRKR
jgi:hypothetical protein